MPQLNGEPVGKAAEWLGELLRAASAHDGRLTAWESQFVDDLAERLERYGARMFITERQLSALKWIERRLGRPRRAGVL